MSDKQENQPRWAKDFDDATWDKINDLVDQGWAAINIERELAIPENKRRSLQLYVQRFGPRRRLVKFAQFQDGILNQIGEYGPKMIAALSQIAANAVNPDVDADIQTRAFKGMTAFLSVLHGLMKDDAKAEHERKIEDGEKKPDVDPARVVNDIRNIYNVPQREPSDG